MMTDDHESEQETDPDCWEIEDVEHEVVDERFGWEECMGWATIRGSELSRMLTDRGLSDIGKGGELLDVLGVHLAEKDMLDEPGELVCCAESALSKTGADTVYFLDVQPRGVPEDFADILSSPTVADSLVRSRLGLSKWEEIPESYDFQCDHAPTAWVTTFRQIAEFNGLRHTDIVATNLIFARSKRFRALKLQIEQVLDCLPAHRLIVDAIQPKLLWATGENFDVVRHLWMLTEIEWRDSHNGGLKFGRGRIEFCGRWMEFAFTPSLASWDATDQAYHEILSWTFPGRVVEALREEGYSARTRAGPLKAANGYPTQ